MSIETTEVRFEHEGTTRSKPGQSVCASSDHHPVHTPSAYFEARVRERPLRPGARAFHDSPLRPSMFTNQ